MKIHTIRHRLLTYFERTDRPAFDTFLVDLSQEENVTIYEVYAQLAYLVKECYVDQIDFIDNIPYTVEHGCLTADGQQYLFSLQ